MTLIPYLLITAADGTLMSSDGPQPYTIPFDTTPLPDRPSVSSAPTPFFAVEDYHCATAEQLSAGGSPDAPPTFTPLSVRRGVDRGTTTFFRDLCAGARLKFVDLVLLHDGPGEIEHNELQTAIGLDIVLVSKLAWAGDVSSDDGLAEVTAFDYQRIWVAYTVLDQHGDNTGYTVRGWDRAPGP
jgi:type VI protein secretion system component Hcp